MSSKIAIVTGATSGIGRATVNRLIADGYLVAAAGRRKHLLDELQNQWGERILTVETDVTRTEDVERLIIQTLDRFQRIDVLINNAGVGAMGPIETAQLSDWHLMVDVNIKGLLNCLHMTLPYLIQSNGHIINLASVAAHDVFPNGVVYCATKHAVNAITVGFRKEFRDRVKVTNVSPGAVDTEFISNTPDGEFKEKFKENFNGVVLKSEDIANAISHILHLPAHLAVNEYIIRPNK